MDLDRPRYVLSTVVANPHLRIRTSPALVSGVVAVFRGHAQKDVAKFGFHDFAWWHPERRPAAQTLALTISPPLDAFASINSGWHRPTSTANWWVADPEDQRPTAILRWTVPQTISEVVIFTDPDYEHPMEHVLFRHHDRISPYAVRDLVLQGSNGEVLALKKDNHHGKIHLRLSQPIDLSELRVEVTSHGEAPAAISAIRVYE